jgi:alkylation response protein AidB-like acyl-CoA dehydrogenase
MSGEGVPGEGHEELRQSISVGDVLVTSAPYHSPEEGWQVLHFAVPMKSEGVCVLNDWHTLGMRGTGSHSVRLDGVFVPDSSITLRRPRGEFHPIFNVVITAALPLIMSVYTESPRRRRGKPSSSRKAEAPEAALGGRDRRNDERVDVGRSAASGHDRMANDLDFEPEDRIGQDMLCRKSNVAKACISVVTRAMEIVGGSGFYRCFGLERLFRDVRRRSIICCRSPTSGVFWVNSSWTEGLRGTSRLRRSPPG